MKNLRRWALTSLYYNPAANALDGYILGATEMRNKIYELIMLTNNTNLDNIKANPELATLALMELAQKVKTLGEDNE